MNITPLLLNFNINKTKSNNNVGTDYRLIKPNYRNQLTQDTVSFSARPDKIIKTGIYTVGDKLEFDYSKKKGATNTIIGNRFVAALKTLGIEGIVYDAEYNAGHLLKDEKTWRSKFSRSGAKPRDEIRQTLFMKDIKNFSLLNKLLEKLEKDFGYIIAPITEGKTTVADFDIRLNDVSQKEINKLPEYLRGLISHKQGSGYGDIQMRLLDTTDNTKTPIELIIVTGKHTADAKHNESYYVYNITRALQKELYITKGKSNSINSPIARISKYIETISTTLTDNISKRLYSIASDMDLYGEVESDLIIKPSLQEDQCVSLKNIMNEIISLTRKHYNAKKAELKAYIKDDARLEENFKASAAYKKRKDKKLYAEDLTEMKISVLEKIEDLEDYQAKDINLLKKLKVNLEESIEKYGQKAEAAEAVEAKPKKK